MCDKWKINSLYKMGTRFFFHLHLIDHYSMMIYFESFILVCLNYNNNLWISSLTIPWRIMENDKIVKGIHYNSIISFVGKFTTRSCCLNPYA